MSSTAVLVLVSVITLAATGGVALAANTMGPAGWHMPWSGQSDYDGDGGMMGGSHMGNGMMGGGYQAGYSDGYPCPNYSNQTWGDYNTTEMPCW